MKKAAFFILLLLLFNPLWAQKKSAETSEGAPPVELNFSLEGGFYPNDVVVELSAPGATVYYTIDGSTPSRNSQRYNRPLHLKETTVLQAVAYHSDGRESFVLGHTYFIGEPRTDFAVVSIGISPSVLFHPRSGLFMLGNNVVDTLWKKPGANFWSRSEFPASVEFFETDGRCAYRDQSGFRLFGGMSRLFPQKSIALVARSRYGDSRIRHKVFGKEGLDKFKFLVLRNSGSDFGKTHFRDALMTGLVDDWDIDKQDYRPVHVYINGQYWGIYNIREKVNRFFIAGHHPEVDNDSIDLVEHRYTRKRGSLRHYLSLLSFLEKNSLADPANYAYVQTQMDVQNFMDYQIAQIYFDNQDAGGNIKFWRPQKPGGRWRWILYDTDWGFGLHGRDTYKHNSLAFHTDPDGPSWPNPPWSTFLLRKLLENKEFEKAFVNRFAGYLSTSFREETVLNRIDSMYRNLLPEIPRHLSRWNLSRNKWEEEVAIVREFAQERPAYVRMHLMGQFNTGPQRRLIVSTSPGGRILINDRISVSNDTVELVYFENFPVTIRAVAHHGYQLSSWEGIEANETQREFTFTLDKATTRLHARFDEFVHPMEGKLVINEICPRNGKAGDWLELFNASRNRVSLKGWTLGDLKSNEFVFPEAYIGPNDYLVLARDSAKFVQAYPGAYNVLNGLNFGLNKRKESLALYSILGAMVDSIAYVAPPTDTSFTLNLLLPYLDNSDPDNWEFRYGDGSPNAANPYYVESRVRNVQAQWMQMGLAAGVLLLSLILLALRQRGLLGT
ncbi:MAG: CotH kinase family protein [Lewinellaceae bacterium]|nr:CotH kinase family protein [Phaeodactylibacter sp.]MCB9346959.1 CotH kinase family protein [Lewinellaceae bacterium]